MKNFKFIFVLLLAGLALLIGIVLILKSDYSLVTHPKGLLARKEWELIITNYLLMFIIVIPTFILLFVIAWKYRSKNAKAKYDSEHYSRGAKSELILWIIPSIVIFVMAIITWDATHELDPYNPIKSDIKPLKIQVVALDWKWLFIYPEQEIATVNFVQFPERIPIHFELCADGSPMNSFWIPQLSGQIYSMSGMITQLHIMADEIGEYMGRAAEINGKGYADMTFLAKTSSQEDFESWIAHVKRSPTQLTDEVYNELLKPSIKDPITLYSKVEEGLFNKIAMKYMPHTSSMGHKH